MTYVFKQKFGMYWTFVWIRFHSESQEKVILKTTFVTAWVCCTWLHCDGRYSVAQANPDSPKKNDFVKKFTIFAQSLQNLSKQITHEYLILKKVRNDWVKIVDF